MKRNFTDLEGKVAVAVGATSGLGRAIAIGLAEAGADVIPTGRHAGEVADACADVQVLGRRTLHCPCNVRDRASLEALSEQVLGEFGRVDILLNAAGVTLKRPTAEIPGEEWDALMDVNLAGTLRACQVFFPALRAGAGGSIVNIASLSSFLAFHQVAAYSASKAAVLSLTRSLGCEWAGEGVRVNALVPGVFPTQLNAKLLDGTPRGAEILQRTPMGRYGRPSEVVGAAVFLASDAASFITGQTIAIDGGYLASGVNS